MDPSSQSHVADQSLHHGVPPWREMGRPGRCNPCRRDGAAGQRSDSGKHVTVVSWQIIAQSEIWKPFLRHVQRNCRIIFFLVEAAVSHSIFAYCLHAINSSIRRSLKTSCQSEGHVLGFKEGVWWLITITRNILVIYPPRISVFVHCVCLQEVWYEFRVMAVMEDLISEPSNVVGVSSTGQWKCYMPWNNKYNKYGFDVSRHISHTHCYVI